MTDGNYVCEISSYSSTSSVNSKTMVCLLQGTMVRLLQGTMMCLLQEYIAHILQLYLL